MNNPSISATVTSAVLSVDKCYIYHASTSGQVSATSINQISTVQVGTVKGNQVKLALLNKLPLLVTVVQSVPCSGAATVSLFPLQTEPASCCYGTDYEKCRSDPQCKICNRECVTTSYFDATKQCKI